MMWAAFPILATVVIVGILVDEACKYVRLDISLRVALRDMKPDFQAAGWITALVWASTLSGRWGA